MNTASDSSYASARCRGCINTNNPYVNYQRQKRIWNTCRVDSSQYVMNKSAVASYSHKIWNQQSDRENPSVQTVYNPSHGNSTKYTLTRDRPGACSPGGEGCDIKFNSYDRYLKRLKGGVLKGGAISPTLTKLITRGIKVYNRADPMYGGKYYKTSIVPCICSDFPSGDIIQHVKPYGSQYNIGDLIRWEKCKGEYNYARVVGILGPKLLIDYMDNYGTPYQRDILDPASNVKKIDVSCFETPPSETEQLQLHKYFNYNLNNIF